MAFKNRFAACLTLFVMILVLTPATATVIAGEKHSQETDRIVIGSGHDYPPYSFRDENGTPTGFNIELTQAIAVAAGLKIEIDYRSWSALREDLETGKIDAISGMYYSKERDKLVDFSTHISIVHHAVFARKDSPGIKSEEELRGKELIVIRGDIMHDYVIEKGLSGTPVLVKNQTEALRLLASDRHDYALIAKLPGRYLVSELKLSNIITVGPELLPSKYCCAVKEGNSILLFRLNEGLTIVKESGRFKELYDKWLGVLEPHSISTKVIIKYSIIILVPLLLLLAGSFLWHRQTLRRNMELEKEIAGRKRAEGELQKANYLYKVLLDASTSGINLLDKDGNYLIVNESAAKIWKNNPGDFINKNIRELVPPQMADEVMLIIRKVEKTRTGLEQERFIEPLNKYYIENVQPIFDENKEFFGVQVLTFDITEYKLAEKEKARLEKQLRHTQKLETIGTLAGGIAHDFNNILAPIVGYADIAMLNLDKTSPVYEHLAHILKGACRAKELVEQILLFSKQSEKERHPLSMHTLVNEALKLLRPSIPSTIEIRQRLDASCGKVQADATQIHQVIVNLCTNAWQAMETDGGILSIELNRKTVDKITAKLHPKLHEGEYVCLSVIDTGPGIDDGTMERMFEPFFTTKPVDKGTGLGLSVAHGVVRSHEGDILVYSEPGKGAAFHVYLPAIRSEGAAVEKTAPMVAGGAESVMIVDDEPVIAEMVKLMLEHFGYKADTYQDGIEALKAFKKQPQKYDLLISDLTMPHMTGLDLATQLHKERPELPVVIMTGFGGSLTPATQERYGIIQVMAKPVSVKELAAVVRDIFDK
ncbi:MAG: transporter substrate-binding domain-containing protein [bacterium]|nr:transporter substrate-binding domain-containing protein [bacterium]